MRQIFVITSTECHLLQLQEGRRHFRVRCLDLFSANMLIQKELPSTLAVSLNIHFKCHIFVQNHVKLVQNSCKEVTKEFKKEVMNQLLSKSFKVLLKTKGQAGQERPNESNNVLEGPKKPPLHRSCAEQMHIVGSPFLKSYYNHKNQMSEVGSRPRPEYTGLLPPYIFAIGFFHILSSSEIKGKYVFINISTPLGGGEGSKYTFPDRVKL